MSEEPSWLTPETGGAAPAPAAPDTFAINNGRSDSAGESTRNAAVDANDSELPGVILTMRLANMGVSVALITCSVLLMMSFPSISNWVLAVYATLGGLLICCLETQLKFLRVMIAVNFGFLFDPLWRFLYYLLMASVCWAYNTLFGKIVGGCLVGVACYNTFVLFRYPSYRKIREKNCGRRR
mmetsp:Transcript_4891/g.6916  ORF Transcript_4891/g.6916 Transcript_4891/m.6916 type:complete len:182 (-) Transcript_4891:300-845(-)